MKKIITLMLVLALAGTIGTATAFATPDGTENNNQDQRQTQTDKVLLKVSCMGDGQIAGTDDGSEPVFNDDAPVQSLSFNMDKGATAKLKAKGNEGFQFVYWFDMDTEEIYSTNDTIEIEINKATELVAFFDEDGERVELRGGVMGEGIIEGTMDGTEPEFDDDFPTQSLLMNVIKGRTARLKAKPKDGYTFVCWINNDTSEIYSMEDTIDVKMEEPLYLVAVFDIAGERHSVNVNIGEGFGELTYTEDGSEPEFDDDHYTSLALSVLEGRTVNLRTRADEGYRFLFWYDEDKNEVISFEDTLSVEVTKDMNITAHFDLDVDRVLLQVNTEGKGQVTGSLTDDDPRFDEDMPFQSLALNVIPGNSVVIKAKADEGYKFIGWRNTADGKIVSTDATYSVEVNEAMELIAVFELVEDSEESSTDKKTDDKKEASETSKTAANNTTTTGTSTSTSVTTSANAPATGDAAAALAALAALTLGSLGAAVLLSKKHRKNEE